MPLQGFMTYLSNLICCMLSMPTALRRSEDLSSTISLSRCDLSSMMTDSVYTYGIYYSSDIYIVESTDQK